MLICFEKSLRAYFILRPFRERLQAKKTFQISLAVRHGSINRLLVTLFSDVYILFYQLLYTDYHREHEAVDT